MIEWVEIGVGSIMQEAAVLAALRAIHVPGERVGQGFRVCGYSTAGKPRATSEPPDLAPQLAPATGHGPY